MLATLIRDKKKSLNIILFAPPFNMLVKNKLRIDLFKISKKHFPITYELCRMFIKNTAKFSYKLYA